MFVDPQRANQESHGMCVDQQHRNQQNLGSVSFPWEAFINSQCLNTNSHDSVSPTLTVIMTVSQSLTHYYVSLAASHSLHNVLLSFLLTLLLHS